MSLLFNRDDCKVLCPLPKIAGIKYGYSDKNLRILVDENSNMKQSKYKLISTYAT